MNLVFTEKQNDFRMEVRAWMSNNVPPQPLQTLECESGYRAHVAWERTLACGRWNAVTWPEEYGGRGLDLIEWLIFEEEYWRAGAPPRANQNGIFLLGPTIMEYGSAEQRKKFLVPMASGEAIWAQVWSEPGAGSDLAGIRTRAYRDGDHYIIDGQKTWSSRAAFADWGFGLFRTGEGSTGHTGLSFILFSLDCPGITRRPIRQFHGDPGFAELFFDSVRVPVANRIGAEGQGWKIAMATAGFERGLMLRSPARFQVTSARLVQLLRQCGRDVAESTREAIASAWMGSQAYAYNAYMVAAQIMAGGRIGAEASLNKIFWSELDQQMHRTAMQMLGAAAELRRLDDDVLNHWLDGYILSLAGPIYAGTNEIQRNIIAERLLELPRQAVG